MQNEKKGTSVKYRDFVAEPMGAKMVTSLPGIGNVLGQRLTNKGYSTASSVLGVYLTSKDNNGKFEEWMKKECGASAKQIRDCRQACKDWSNKFL